MQYPLKRLSFKCPHCGHQTEVNRSVRESVKAWLKDEMGNCFNCHKRLRKKNYSEPKVNPKVMAELKEELGIS